MKPNADLYLEKAQEYEAKAEQTDDPTLKITFQDLARSYRILAIHDPATKSRRLKDN